MLIGYNVAQSCKVKAANQNKASWNVLVQFSYFKCDVEESGRQFVGNLWFHPNPNDTAKVLKKVPLSTYQQLCKLSSEIFK